MSLSSEVPKNGFEADMMEKQQDRSLGEKAKDVLNTAAEKTKDFVDRLQGKIEGEDQMNKNMSDEHMRSIVEQRQRLDRHLFESASAAPKPELAGCHETAACVDCVSTIRSRPRLIM